MTISGKILLLVWTCSLLGSIRAQSSEPAVTSSFASACPDSKAAVEVGESDEGYIEIYRGPEMRYRSQYAYASATNGTYADQTVPLRLQWILQRVQSDLRNHCTEGETARWCPEQDCFCSTRPILAFFQDILEEGNAIIKELRELSEEMDANAPLRQFSCVACRNRDNDSACRDLDEWNWTFNTSLGRNNQNFSQITTWRDSPTIFVESYFHRRLNHIFQKSQTLHDWDFFGARKAALLDGKDSIIRHMFEVMRDALEKAARLNGTFVQAAALSRVQLRDLLQMSVWAEKQDNDIGRQGLLNKRISMNRSTSTSGRLNLDQEKESLKKTLLLDGSEKIWNSIITAKNLTSVRMDVICGGYGLELISDLILGEYLVSSTLAKRVHFHLKAMPWFETDATYSDFHKILDLILKVVPEYGERFKERLSDGSFVVSAEMYWTLPFQYEWMRIKDPVLHRELMGADLLLFKGDLNYRKLVGWQSNTGSLSSSLLTLFSDKKVNIALLRTIKSDPVGGLSLAQEDALFAENENWRLTGNYALIDFEAKYDFE